MAKDDQVFLGHMLDMARMAHGKVREKSRAEFDGDENLQMALVHLIQVIGEAARRVSDDCKKSHAAIHWPQIIGMRHKVVHDYLQVDYDIVWDVATVHLEPLILELEKLTAPPPTN